MKNKPNSSKALAKEIKIDKRLDKVNPEGWFQDKVDKANCILKTVGLFKGHK